MKSFFNRRQDIKFKQETFPDEILPTAINKLVYGCKVEKIVKQGKKKHLRFFYLLNDDIRYLQWISPHKPFTKSRIYLSDIKDISREIHWRVKNKKSQNFLRIQTATYEIVLTFKVEQERDIFQCGLQHFTKLAVQNEDKRQDSIKHLADMLFLNADKDGNKQLSLEEVKRLLQEIHVSINKKYLKQLFLTYDVNKNGQIDQSEFINVIRDITKKEELQSVFSLYCPEYNSQLSQDQEEIMTIQQYKNFLETEQKQKNVISEDIYDLFKNLNNNIQSYGKGCDSTKSTTNLKISFYQFSNLIFSQENYIFDSQQEEIYQNMDRPLTDYFINSSHNTYLMANQLTGESSCQAYINAFLKGCRCVELDCWDGEKNEPLVYHGHTLTSRILFKDVLEIINKYAFMLSPYPVILSFENHCSLEQTKIIAKYLNEIFGDKLYIVPQDYENFQQYKSPNELKGKIIVKSKGKVERVYCQDTEQDISDFTEEEEVGSKNYLTLLEQNNNIIPDYAEAFDEKRDQNQGKKVTIFKQKNKEEQEEIIKQLQTKKAFSQDSRQQSFHNINMNASKDFEKNNNQQNGQLPHHSRQPSQFKQSQVQLEQPQDFHNIIQEKQNSLNVENQNLIIFEDDDYDYPTQNIILRASKDQFSSKPNVSSRSNIQIQKTIGDTNTCEDDTEMTDSRRLSNEQYNTKIVNYFQYQSQSQNQQTNKQQIFNSFISNSNNQQINDTNRLSNNINQQSPNLTYSPNIFQSQSINSDFNGQQTVRQQLNQFDLSDKKSSKEQRKQSKDCRKSIKNCRKSTGRSTKAEKQSSHTQLDEEGKKKKKKNKQKIKVKECRELLEITTMFGCHMDIKAVNKLCWYISSISETKYEKLIHKYPQELLNMFKNSFVRLYPAGVRVDSSNYDPIKGFLSGSQIVALNFQTNDFPMLLNHSKFQQNGGIRSGYILKPDYMQYNTEKTYYPVQMQKIIKTVRIQILSGQQLRPEDYEQDTFDVVDPYIQVFVKGTDFDENNNKPQVTDIIADNGFHPIWNSQEFEFNFACPELAMIVFRVMDSDVGVDTQLGIYSAPIDCLRPGYRIIPLRSKSNLEFIDHSVILVKIQIEEKIEKRYVNNNN